jgi:hypothetical protein
MILILSTTAWQYYLQVLLNPAMHSSSLPPIPLLPPEAPSLAMQVLQLGCC